MHGSVNIPAVIQGPTPLTPVPTLNLHVCSYLPFTAVIPILSVTCHWAAGLFYRSVRPYTIHHAAVCCPLSTQEGDVSDLTTFSDVSPCTGGVPASVCHCTASMVIAGTCPPGSYVFRWVL
jgi:hypothetical protein